MKESRRGRGKREGRGRGGKRYRGRNGMKEEKMEKGEDMAW